MTACRVESNGTAGAPMHRFSLPMTDSSSEAEPASQANE